MRVAKTCVLLKQCVIFFSRYTPSNLLQFVTHYTRWFWTTCEGVDPNRNFAYHWGEEKERGASSDPCHETYSGPFAFSEPETKAMADYILANKQHIRYVNCQINI